ncbi:DNA ligase D [Paenibacillus sp. IB182493]|uniref:DNA ligase D n=2 Tax=Paenibacillus arenilitoris TaxID=2772299 RepID=A0A927CPN9_9BACL|nr:DNA ligase D [Paenibacillus arenilitoris]
MEADKSTAALLTKKPAASKGFFFLLGYSLNDESFMVGVLKDNAILPVGSFATGLKREEARSLLETIRTHQVRSDRTAIRVNPGICVELSFDAAEGDRLINPAFRSFQFGMDWKACTWNKLIVDQAPVRPEVKLTHPDKIVWDNPRIDKEGYAAYLVQIAPQMLPFLKNRVLTTIRYVHGVPGEAFYQKNCPDYAPDFIQTAVESGIRYIVCNDLSTLLWLGNQLAIEFHIPFQTVGEEKPLEIVFDLDPPGRERFPLAVKAASELRTVFEQFGIRSYPKLSGGKGLQIHIPLSRNTSLTYDDTRIFTAFIADYLVERFPDDFTTERLKKNRGARLYVDYIQHAAGKTIVCPYSARGNAEATVAAPLYWDEVNARLRPDTYNLPFVLNRLATGEEPMRDFFEQENKALIPLIAQLKHK